MINICCKKYARKVLSVLLAVVLLAALCPMPARAASVSVSSFSDLQSALSSAEAGTLKSIELSADITLTGSLSVNAGKVVTIDLNGYTLTANGNTYLTVSGAMSGDETKKSTLNIEDSSAAQTGNIVGTPNGIIAQNGGVLNIRGGTLQVVKVQTYGVINMTGGTVKNPSSQSVYLWNNGLFIMTGGTVNGNIPVYIDGNENLVEVSQSAEIAGTWVGLLLSNNANNSEIHINGGRVTGGTNAVIIQNNNSNIINVYIRDGYISGNGNNMLKANAGVDDAKNRFKITGGHFSSNKYNGTNNLISDLIPAGSGSSLQTDPVDGWYIVSGGTPVVTYEARINSTDYQSLTDALANQSSNTVELLKNVSGNYTVSHSGTIDLGGYTLSGSVSITDSSVTSVIQNGTLQLTSLTNGGTLTVPSTTTVTGNTSNSGTLTITGGSFATVTNTGTMTISGGTFDYAGNKDSNDQFAHAASVVSGKVATHTGDKWVIEDAPIPTNEAKIGTTEYATLTEALNAQSGNTVELLKNVTGDYTMSMDGTLDLGGFVLTGTLTVSGTADVQHGTVSAITNDGDLSLQAGLTVTGTLTNTSNAEITITGGSFGSVTNNGEMNISGGTFGAVSNTGDLSISGGTFAQEGNTTAGEFAHAASVTADRKAVSSGTDWVIQDRVYVASVNGVNKETLAEALLLQNNDTVTLLADVSGEFTVSGSGTIDLSGYTLTGTLTVNNGVETLLQNGTLDLTGLTNNGTLALPDNTSVSGETDNSGVLTISAGSFGTVDNTGTLTISGGTFGAVENTGTLSISGGEFTISGNTADGQFSLEECIAGEMMAVKNNGYWIIVAPGGNVAEYNGNLYSSVQNAVDAIPEGTRSELSAGTITLIADSSYNAVLIDRAYVDITIDLNGFVLRGNGGDSVIKLASSSSILTITDSNPTAEHTDSGLPAGGVITGGHPQYNNAYRTGSGGGIYAQGTLYFTAGTIFRCVADYKGGGICCEQTGCTCTMSGGRILECYAGDLDIIEGRGGGIYSDTPFVMSGGTIEGCYLKPCANYPSCGGGIFVSNGLQMYGDSLITGCYAYVGATRQNAKGGGICADKSNISVYGNATISDCHATMDSETEYCQGFGGGIYIESSTASAGNSTKYTLSFSGNARIINCSADKEGGGILVGRSNLNMTGGMIDGCTCITKGGGGLSFWGKDDTEYWSINLSGGTIANCQALYNSDKDRQADELKGGGAICAYDNAVNLSGNFKITGNMAINGFGGGILLGNPGAELKISGAPEVLGNVSDGIVDNVYVYKNRTIEVVGPLTDGCAVGVTTYYQLGVDRDSNEDIIHSVPFTSGYETYNGNTQADAYFISDNPAYAIANLDPTPESGKAYGEAVFTDETDKLTIIYHANGGEFPADFDTNYNYKEYDTTLVSGDPTVSVTIAPSTGVARSGYEFQCWNTSVDGSGTSVTPGETTTVIGRGTLHLYAQWHRIVSYNLTIGSDLKINFFVEGIPDTGDTTGYTMAFFQTSTGKRLCESQGVRSSADEYKFTMVNVYPQNMFESVTANLYNADGLRVCSIESSVEEYCCKLYDSYSGESDDYSLSVVRLAADTLAYGAAAYKYRYGTEATVPEWVSENVSDASPSALEDQKIANGVTDDTIEIGQSGLLLGNSVYVYFVLEVKSDNSNNYHIENGKHQTVQAYTSLEENGRTVADLSKAGTYYIISDPIRATNGVGTQIAYLYQGTTKIQQTMDTVYSYIARNYESTQACGKNGSMTLEEICTALYRYCNSAKAYAAAAKARTNQG